MKKRINKTHLLVFFILIIFGFIFGKEIIKKYNHKFNSFENSKNLNNQERKQAPKDMVWIEGGTYQMGADLKLNTLCSLDGLTSDSKVHKVKVDGFWIDTHEVTNAEFAKFVKETGYVTVAEQTPTKEEFPDALPEMLYAGSVVFTPPKKVESLYNYLQWWSFVKGANWRHPYGENSDIKGKDNYPVVHVAWEDAMAYAKWAGKDLPTEAEWEFAARGGKEQQKFVWGNTFTPHGKHMANTFQGKFPTSDIGSDGYKGIAPVMQFPKNEYGLYDMAGNVWEWCSDWYDADYFNTITENEIQDNPTGSLYSNDPQEMGVQKKVQKGGSFLCSDQYCSRYVLGTRGKGEWRSGSNHVGFRCVKRI